MPVVLDTITEVANSTARSLVEISTPEQKLGKWPQIACKTDNFWCNSLDVIIIGGALYGERVLFMAV